MKVGFIGLGNMAGAMIGGILQRQVTTPEQIIGFDRMEEVGKRVGKEHGIRIAASNQEVAEQAEILFLAVKPVSFAEVIQEIHEKVKPGSIVVSIAAGLTLEYLKSAFSRDDVKLVRCMPNAPAMVLEGCTAVSTGSDISQDELERVLKLLRAFGTASVVPESLMDAVVGISGSSPAYIFLFIEAMADAAVAEGMPRKQAYEFAAQAVLGSAKMVLETGKHPGELKDMVCSPGGTTIQAVKVLEERGLRGTVYGAVEACIMKSKSMGLRQQPNKKSESKQQDNK